MASDERWFHNDRLALSGWASTILEGWFLRFVGLTRQSRPFFPKNVETTRSTFLPNFIVSTCRRGKYPTHGTGESYRNESPGRSLSASVNDDTTKKNRREGRNTVWSRRPGLNGRPAVYETAALPTELRRHLGETEGGTESQSGMITATGEPVNKEMSLTHP